MYTLDWRKACVHLISNARWAVYWLGISATVGHSAEVVNEEKVQDQYRCEGLTRNFPVTRWLKADWKPKTAVEA
jgi:hypothetical protein